MQQVASQVRKLDTQNKYILVPIEAPDSCIYAASA